MPPHLKKLINQARLENGTYEQIVTQLEKKLELNGLEAPDELQVNTVSQLPTHTHVDTPKSNGHHCKKNGTLEKSVSLVQKNSDNKLKLLKTTLETKTLAPRTLTHTATSTTTTTTTKTVSEQIQSHKPFTNPVSHVKKQSIPQTNAILEPMQPIDRLPGTEDRKKRKRSKKEPIKVTLLKLLKLQPKI